MAFLAGEMCADQLMLQREIKRVTVDLCAYYM